MAVIGLCVALIPKGTDTPAETMPPVAQTQETAIPDTTLPKTQEPEQTNPPETMPAIVPTTVPTVPATVPTEPPAPTPRYTLMEDEVVGSFYTEWIYTPVFGSQYRRTQISSITFLASVENAPADSWDVSQEQNGTVLAWVIPKGQMYDLYIAADGGVVAPENCRKLFAGYDNLVRVDFNGAFDTSKVTNMRALFEKCENLREVDVSGFDTSNVTNMRAMFCNCRSLTEVDVSGFDTSKVTDMDGMFYYCSSLKKLDVSGFDTSNVEIMIRMFYNCWNLTDLDVSGFDVSKVTQYEEFMNSGRTINGRPWQEFFRK